MLTQRAPVSASEVGFAGTVDPRASGQAAADLVTQLVQCRVIPNAASLVSTQAGALVHAQLRSVSSAAIGFRSSHEAQHAVDVMQTAAFQDCWGGGERRFIAGLPTGFTGSVTATSIPSLSVAGQVIAFQLTLTILPPPGGGGPSVNPGITDIARRGPVVVLLQTEHLSSYDRAHLLSLMADRA